MADNKVEIVLSAVDQTGAALSSVNAGLGKLSSVAASIAPALATAFSGAGIAAMTKSAIDAADALNDLSQKTGISVSGLASYKLAAEQSGTSLEAVAKGMRGLSVEIVKNGDAFKKIGIDTKDVDTAMRQIAELFAVMPDGMEKAALAAELFGKKVGADMIPLLNMGAEGLDESAAAAARYGAIMQAMAPAADQFNDSLQVITLNLQAMAAETVSSLLPALNVLAAEFAKTTGEASALTTTSQALKTVFETIAVLGVNVAYVFSQVGNEIGGVAAQLAALARLDFKGFSSIGTMMKEDAAQARQAVEALSAKILNPPVVEALKKTGSATDEQREKWKKLLGEFARTPTATGGAKKAVDELAAVLNKINAKDSGVDSSYWKDLATLFEGYQKGRLSAEAYAEAVGKLTAQQKFAVDATNEAKKSEEAYQREMEKSRTEIDRYLTSLEDKATALESELSNYGKTKAEIEATTIARLEEQRAIASGFDSQEELVANLDREIAARQRAQAAMQGIEASDVAKKAAEDSAKAWEKFADQIEQSLTDALFRSFEAGDNFGESFAKNLQNTFKTMVLKVAVQAIVQPVSSGIQSLIGGESPGGAGSSLSSLGNLSSLLNIGSGVGASAASLAAANLSGAVGGDAIGTLIAGNAATWGVEAGAVGGMSGALGTLAAAAPYVAAIAGIAMLAKSLFKSGGPKTEGDIFATLNDTGVSSLANYSANGGKGFTSDVADQAAAALVVPLSESIATMAKKYGGSAAGLNVGIGYSNDPKGSSPDGIFGSVSNAATGQGYVHGYTAERNTYQTEIGVESRRVMLAALQQSGLEDWANEIVQSVNAATATGPQIDELFAKLENTAGVVAATKALESLSGGAIKLTQDMIAAMGGFDAARASLAAYHDLYFTGEEKSSKLRSDLAASFESLGIALPQSKAQFRSIVESLDLTTTAGQNTFTAMMNMGPAFAQLAAEMDAAATEAAAALAKIAAERQSWQNKLDVLTGATTERNLQMQADLASTTDATTQALIRQVYAQEDLNASAAAAAQQAAAIASERIGLENQLLQAQGNTAAIRAGELAALDVSNRALQEQVWLTQDQAAVAQQRLGLENQLLQLQGNTAELRARELASIDESNRALQEQIWSIQDAATAAAAAAAAAEEQARAEEAARQAAQQAAEQAAQQAAAAAAAIAAERAGLQRQLWQAQGDTVSLRAAELSALDASNRALQEQIWLLEDQAAAAQKAAQVESERLGLQKQLWQLQGNTNALRAAELAALDPANRALQVQIWALQDSKTAADEWTRAWENLSNTLRDQARKLRGEVAGSSSAALLAQFATDTAAARAGDEKAAGRLSSLSAEVLSAYAATASSNLDIVRMGASLAASLEKTADTIDATSPTASQNEELVANEVRGLRDDGRIQSAALAGLLAKLANLTERWERDGLPPAREEII